jgi:sugar transferase (PEP-CTERM/EpsH1 system associated)
MDQWVEKNGIDLGKNMRILFLTHRLPYAPNRGDRIRAFHLLRLLGSRHQVHVVSLVHDDEEESHLSDMKTLATSARAARVPKLRNHVNAIAALAGSRPLTHVLLASQALNTAIEDAVKETNPDLVLAYCTGAAEPVFRAPLDRIPCVLDLVDVDSQKWADLAGAQSGPMKWIYRREARVLRAFEHRFAQRARAVTVVSERERDVAEQSVGIPNVIVVPVGVDAGRWAPPAHATPLKRVVFTGVFNYAPNEQGALWFVSEVWPLVKRREPEAELMLVGMSPSGRVKALAQPGSIVVTGAVPDVRPYLWEASAAIAPLWLSRGTQTKVLEALAAGAPCVVTPAVRGGLPAAAQEACICRDDAATFADAVTALLRQPAAPHERAALCQSMQSLQWDDVLKPFLEIVERAAQSGSFKG